MLALSNKRTNMSKVALVTGASSGIGKAVALELRNEGFTVFGASRKVTTGIVENDIIQLKMDVNSEPSVKAAVDYIIQEQGKIDVVINNAGLGIIGAVESVSDEEVKEIFDTNVFGVLNVCRHTIPYLKKQSKSYIFNITSIAGLMGLPFRGIYSASKYAVEGLSESLSQEVKDFGIKVILIEPGDFNTNINQTRKIAKNTPEEYLELENKVLDQVNREVSSAPNPSLIGRKIISIMKKRYPRLRYKVATPFQKFSVLTRDIIPDRWFEYLIMWYYKV
ncbi:MAG: SDR family oxidoreductase [Flavobacteriales bacterium]